ncbi:Na/Pi cotransporter family protein [Thermogemmatispora tikiterensis]|uniref:Sodium:phosphate symporter n=1 Tax=Thermogemmatispora tikiterensis TaxID=1825093 RepID=A0A328VQR5_9CHLR|nr:Na/Pi cotransporter family protein [Thermogemmatispora tikiterensis]RAQ98100.1 sodium:phosphate symporter [Thermogemmatispora tikiterensis]
MATTSNPTMVVGLLLGGALLLLYGLRLLSEAMQRAAGPRLQKATMALAQRPFMAFGVGVVVTALTQSSSATSSLLVELVNAELVPLTTAFVMILGTNVGSTLVVQLLAFHVTDYAIPIAGAGAALGLLTQHKPQRNLGQAAFGFGVILLGLAALQVGSAPIAASPVTAEVLRALMGAPLVLALLGLLLALAFASSAAAIGLVLVLTASGALSVFAALALLFGANIGSTLTALLTAISRPSITGRRLALLHTGTKSLGAAIALALLPLLTSLLARLGLEPVWQVALTHLTFNLALAAVFVPLAAPVTHLVTLLLPEQENQYEQPLGPRYLDPEALASPAVALGQATREVLRMADIVTEMLRLSMLAFEKPDARVPERINELDDELDQLNAAIKRYLTQLDESRLTREQVQRELALLYIITDLEAIGDIIDRQMMRLARRKQRRQVAFSEEGWQDLLNFHDEVTEALEQALAALASQDTSLANDFFVRKAELSKMKRQLHLRHVRRLQSGLSPSWESSAIHLDLLNALSRVLSHASNIAHAVRGDL